MKRLLVTGATGFVGQWVTRCLSTDARHQFEVVPMPTLDIRNLEAVVDAVSEIRPNAVLHLAAQSFVPRSFEAPRETLEINLFGTLNLLQALQRVAFPGRMLFVSSGDVFGRVPDAALPVNEAWQAEPRNPYAVSKLAAEKLCLQWHHSEGMDVCIARPFNHVGPGQDDRFVLPSLARQVAEISSGAREPIVEAGDIDVSRDFTDVRDVVEAYAAILTLGVSGRTYLIGSGRERSIRELLVRMCELEGVEVKIHQDPRRMRPSEQRRMVADPRLLYEDTGWRPQTPMDVTLRDILDYARKD
ncbi:GDP-mannose 4,6-dehydratase [Pseudomarimonas salicorniae]|uniref:GDP-mannose 4,6-dehydratase n=1 Tax=Pseudomarimonas salicorniae TaxID=2933270 RepID=A0ABT0GIT6_9GAMM|nr:GDP-mannose 4,6-dehydratase [Lysobacter sp. CAU 1642]MCK7594457.1 GDP-mannose 4,6-dehydratase [Lysobacter sp. CAU 1642]